MAATAQKLAEQIETAEKEIKQKENRLIELRQQHKAQASKEQTHWLIERGAILESLVEGALALTNEQIKTFLEKTVQTDFARKILTQLTPQNAEETGEKSESEQVTPDGI